MPSLLVSYRPLASLARALPFTAGLSTQDRQQFVNRSLTTTSRPSARETVTFGPQPSQSTTGAKSTVGRRTRAQVERAPTEL